MRTTLKDLRIQDSRDFRARTRLPKLFISSDQVPETLLPNHQLLASYAEEIKTLLGKEDKHSHKDMKGKPYSIFAFTDDEGIKHFYLTPITHKRILSEGGKKSRINILGKGGEGVVIPAYELSYNNGVCTINPNELPKIKIKIVYSNAEKEKNTQSFIENQVKIIRKGYKEKTKVFPKLLRRVKEKTRKFYMGMSNFPGLSGAEFNEIHKMAYDKSKISFASFPEENRFKRELFLISLRFAISAIEQVELFEKNGYRHCDLKPENFILYQNEASLIDLSFAQETNLIEDFSLRGTYLYYAPELYKTESCKYDPKNYVNSDKCSLGLTLAQLLGGVLEKPLNFKNIFDNDFKIYLESEHKRISPNFLVDVPIDEEIKNRIRTSIYASVGSTPSERPKISAVREEFKKIADELEESLVHETFLKEGKGKEEREESDSAFYPSVVKSSYDSSHSYLISLPTSVEFPDKKEVQKVQEVKVVQREKSDSNLPPSVVKFSYNSGNSYLFSFPTQVKSPDKKEVQEVKEIQEVKVVRVVQEMQIMQVVQELQEKGLNQSLKIYTPSYKAAYEHIYPNDKGVREVENMNEPEKINDKLNFLCWIISHPDFQQVKKEEQKNILSALCVDLKIGHKGKSNLEMISDIQEEVNHKNSEQEFVTLWQYHRMYENYKAHKDSKYESAASSEAIQAANCAKSPSERYVALISNYYEKKSSYSFQFFGTSKDNSDSAFGLEIAKIRSPRNVSALQLN